MNMGTREQTPRRKHTVWKLEWILQITIKMLHNYFLKAAVSFSCFAGAPRQEPPVETVLPASGLWVARFGSPGVSSKTMTCEDARTLMVCALLQSHCLCTKVSTAIVKQSHSPHTEWLMVTVIHGTTLARTIYREGGRVRAPVTGSHTV